LKGEKLHRNAGVTLIPRNDLTVDLLESLLSNAEIQDVASVQQCQKSLGALNQPLQNIKRYVLQM